MNVQHTDRKNYSSFSFLIFPYDERNVELPVNNNLAFGSDILSTWLLHLCFREGLREKLLDFGSSNTLAGWFSGEISGE